MSSRSTDAIHVIGLAEDPNDSSSQLRGLTPDSDPENVFQTPTIRPPRRPRFQHLSRRSRRDISNDEKPLSGWEAVGVIGAALCVTGLVLGGIYGLVYLGVAALFWAGKALGLGFLANIGVGLASTVVTILGLGYLFYSADTNVTVDNERIRTLLQTTFTPEKTEKSGLSRRQMHSPTRALVGLGGPGLDPDSDGDSPLVSSRDRRNSLAPRNLSAEFDKVAPPFQLPLSTAQAATTLPTDGVYLVNDDEGEEPPSPTSSLP